MSSVAVQEWLTIDEACQRTGRSQIAIRALIQHALTDETKHQYLLASTSDPLGYRIHTQLLSFIPAQESNEYVEQTTSVSVAEDWLTSPLASSEKVKRYEVQIRSLQAKVKHLEHQLSMLRESRAGNSSFRLNKDLLINGGLALLGIGLVAAALILLG